MEQLKSWLRGRHQIAVAVYSTPAAEAVLANNGLTIVDFLRPMSLVNKLNVPMRVGELSYRVQEVNLRLYAGDSMFQPKSEVIDQSLGQLLSLQAQRHTNLQPMPNLIQQVQSDSPETINPWFYAYQSEFLRLLRFTEHETLDHPVAGIFCIPADKAQALQIAQKLLTPESQLPLQASQSMLPLQDPMFAKHFVLVQDVAAGMDEARAKSNLTALSNTYGAANCSILRLYGSSTGGAAVAAVPAAVFQACRHPNMPGGGAGEPEHYPKEPPGGIGHSITADDMAAAGQLLKDFCERTLLPKLEERIARLNLIISNARKGFKNKLTRFWKGAATETVQYQDVSYPYHSIEAQMRCVADLAYLLGQYDFAVQMYRLAAQDYLAAPNSRWYAGAEEMIGICSILLGDPNADPIKYFNRAFEHYSKVRGWQARMLATRVMLITAAYQAATGRHLAANVSLMRAHFEEETARAALLLEAAAYALLRCRPPSARKAAFHLVLAGLRYQSAKQRRLAIHCYMQVTGIYSASSWRHISEHLHDILGKQCYELGDTQGALRHCMALLDCGHRQAAAQSHYLSRFLEAVQAAGTVAPIKDLPLPSVTTNSVVVRHADQRCYPSSTQRQQLLLPAQGPDGSTTAATAGGGGGGQFVESSAAVWSHLEQLVAGGEASSTNWLEGAKQVYEGEEFNTVAAGEDIGIEVTFRNPLAIKLTLSRVRLIGQFTAAGAGVPAAAAAADGSAAAAAEPDPDQVAVVESQLSLHPGEVLTERLLLRPAAAGWLRVTGVSWVLAGTAGGYCLFDIKGRRRKRPKGDRPSQQKHYPPGRRLLFHVLKGMPRLQVSLERLPTEAAAGELLGLQVVVKNVGLAPAQNLKVAISSPHVALAAAAAAQSGQAGDIWQQLQTTDGILQPLGNKATHRRHKSSAAALLSEPAAAAAASSRGFSSESGGRATRAAAVDSLQQQQQHNMPHVHSMPSVQEEAAAAAGAVGQGYSGSDPPAARSAAGPAAVFQIGQYPEQQLDPGQVLSIPMWVHIPPQSNTSRFTFHCAWYCEPPATAAAAAMRYRVLLTQHSLSITNLVDLQPSVSPDVKDLHRYNLRLEASCSKDAGRGVLVLQQLSCLTAGADVGWKLGNFAAAAAASAAGSAQRHVCPGLRLTPGDSCTHYVQLVSPAAAAAAATGAAASSSSSNQDLVLSVQKGPLQYFCRQGSPTVFGSSGGAAAAAAGDSRSLLLQQRPAAAAAAALAAEAEVRQPSLIAEPPVDFLVLWRFEPTAAAAAAAGSLPQQQQQHVRAGFISYYNLCAALQLNPIRMTLDGPGMKTAIKHDFRSASMCIAPLRLGLRNCGVTDVSVTVRASAAWEGLSNDHAWFATHCAPGSKHTGLLGPAAAAAGGIAVSSSPRTVPTVAATAGLPPRPKTPTAAAGAAAATAGGVPLPGGLVSSLPGVSGFVPGALVANATEGLGAVLGGLNLGSVGGPSPIRGADGSSSSSSPAAAAAAGPFSSATSHLAPIDSPGWGTATAAVQAGLAPSSEHIWCGSTCVPVRQLAPGGFVEVVLQVGVFRPGVYVLDDYGIDWRCEGSAAGARVRQGSKVGEAIVLRVEAA